jgi:predicted dehydrogenase
MSISQSRRRSTRREFLRHSALAGTALTLSGGVWSSRSLAATTSPNEKLNIGVIGTANQARFSINAVKQENIVAACDIDDKLLSKMTHDFPKAKPYNDFRKLIEHAGIDAIVVAVPDHIHAPATAAALHLGKHVYCEKPLTHTVAECRAIERLAAEKKVATQMGTQIHASDNYRRVVEIIQSGAIGPVSEVHTWAWRDWGGGTRPTDRPPVPPNIHWNLWLGPAPERPYSPVYFPMSWRRWWDFGNGNLGDMACHHMDLPFWALGLKHPTAVEADGPPVNPETCALGLKIHYEFRARGDQPAVKLTWYDGTSIPNTIHGHHTGGGGNLFVGEKGMLWADYGKYHLYPKEKFAGYTPPPPTIPRSIGHHAEWLLACKTGSPTTCNFGYAGPLSEAVLLGAVAYRAGKRIEWDAENLRATNCPEAEEFLHSEYRKGWTL